MNPATQIMQKEIFNTEFKDSNNLIISNVTSKEMQKSQDIKDLLVKQIESPVRWRESIIYMIKNNVKNFVEIGPGKILSGMIKRIDRNVNIVSVNELDDIKNISFND
jgi:[acyl-carrier-protein] S-malonyltransferase